MKRIQLFEFEDFDWFPKTIRIGMTNLIVVFQKLIGTNDVVSNLIKKIRAKHHFNTIVDLGSGSGGVMLDVIKKLNTDTEQPIELLLTDLYPTTDFVLKFNKSNLANVAYHKLSVDATHLNETPKGLKTMMNSFHHMPPKKAKMILKSAQDSNTPLLIYELAENKIPLILWWILLPFSLVILVLMALFMTPFVKRLSWQQLFFTYIIPVIPLCYAWDGQASLVRIYSFADVRELIADLENNSYSWEISPAKNATGRKAGYYIIGLPNKYTS